MCIERWVLRLLSRIIPPVSFASPNNKTTAASPSKIRVGNTDLSYGKQIGEMTDSSDLYHSGQFEKLRARLHQDGFIWVRG